MMRIGVGRLQAGVAAAVSLVLRNELQFEILESECWTIRYWIYLQLSFL